jgi:hypothetical protein
MTKTVIGLISKPSEAEKAIDELLDSGFDRKRIGVVSSELLSEASAAMRGATSGMAIGGAAGLLLAAAAIAIPGIGPALVAGPAAALFASTMVGALAGGLIGGLTTRGVPEDEAHFYAEGLRRGGTLITVNAENEERAARAVEIMKRHGAVDIAERAAEWKKQGWSGRFEDREQPAHSAGAENDPPAKHGIPARETVNESFQADSANERTTQARGTTEPHMALSAVHVYSFVIEPPVGEVTASSEAAATRARGTAANQTKYMGRDRRTGKTSYAGAERRQAAGTRVQ